MKKLQFQAGDDDNAPKKVLFQAGDDDNAPKKVPFQPEDDDNAAVPKKVLLQELLAQMALEKAHYLILSLAI